MAHWTLDDIDWTAFRPDRVDPELLRVAKATALVEHNGADYAIYFLYRLREELLRRVNLAARPARVKDVLFKEMLVQ